MNNATVTPQGATRPHRRPHTTKPRELFAPPEKIDWKEVEAARQEAGLPPKDTTPHHEIN